MYYQLGNIKFQSLIGPNSLVQSKSANYAQHDTIETKPRLQRLGMQLDTVSMGIKFHSRFCNPQEQINNINTALTDAQPLPFFTGSGLVFGYFVLTKVDITTLKTGTNGDIWEADLSIELLEFFDPQLDPSGFANAALNPVLAPGQSFQSDTVQVQQEITAISDEVGQMDSDLTDMENNSDEEDLRRAKMSVSSNKVLIFTDKLETASNGDSVIDTLAALRAYLGDFRTATNALKALLTSGSITDIRSALANLQLGLDNIKVLSAGTLIIYATRRG
jgi:phage protein U